MASFWKKIYRSASECLTKKAMELAQATTVPTGEKRLTEGLSPLARQAAAEGMVLLKNTGALPLPAGERVAVFGRCQVDTFYAGYGSGGDVKPIYQVSYLAGLLEAEREGKLRLDHALLNTYQHWCSQEGNRPASGVWGRWPTHHAEMPLGMEQVRRAAEKSATGLVILGRAAGEDRESQLIPGSYYLTREEERLLHMVTAAFEKTVVVLNCGNVMDLSWIEKYGKAIQSVLYAWQGGMEAGNALADVLTGAVNPCGKLTDTIARRYEDQPSACDFGGKDFNTYTEDIFVGYRYFETFAPEKVLFPFGFGLSYTHFSLEVLAFSQEEREIHVTVRVVNSGGFAGREVVQLYVQAPQGRLGKASRTLAAFAKTKLLAPGEGETILLQCSYDTFASYDDSGAAGQKHAYVLEKGAYLFHIGVSVRQTQVAGTVILEEDLQLSQHQGVCGVQHPFQRLHAFQNGEAVQYRMETVPKKDYCLKKRILRDLPKEIPYTGDRGISFRDVLARKASLDDFLAQLRDQELEALTRGYGAMNAPQGAPGNAGAVGGIIPSLVKKGVTAVTTTDGPCGIRLNAYSSQLPCGTLLASTWDVELVEALYERMGAEMEYRHSHVLLGAGMNIHRNPLCGRNFEYFSEDPLLTGKMGAAFTRGIQSHPGRSACPKHFACNNQEFRRSTHDSRVSERALREIYLKGFEITVKESAPNYLMTSYNKINGVWSHYNYDLAATLLRKEWNFRGLVLTDWGMRRAVCPEFPRLRDNAYRIRAQVDVLMPGNLGTMTRGYRSDKALLKSLRRPGGLTRGELQRCARRTLQALIPAALAEERSAGVEIS